MTKISLALVITILLLSSCVSTQTSIDPSSPSIASATSASSTDEWVTVYPGIEKKFIINKDLPIAVFAFRVDLQHPDREVLVSSLEPRGEFETRSKTVSSFARQYDTLLAINATTFSPYREEEGLGVNLTTLSISEGEIQSPQKDPMAALLVMEDGSVELHWPPFDYSRIRYAAGSGPLYLLDGKNRGRTDQRHPRSGVGLSRDGRYLIFMVIDGRKNDYSVGATMAEAANWMRDLGAWTAMNLDGGGSSTLVLKDPDSGKWIVVNEPSGPPGRGQERAVANHIGIR